MFKALKLINWNSGMLVLILIAPVDLQVRLLRGQPTTLLHIFPKDEMGSICNITFPMSQLRSSYFLRNVNGVGGGLPVV